MTYNNLVQIGKIELDIEYVNNSKNHNPSILKNSVFEILINFLLISLSLIYSNPLFNTTAQSKYKLKIHKYISLMY